MTYICYVEKSFHGKSLALIEKANDILAEYEGQGYTLTLRQLYYQFVARAIIENSERSYKALGSLVSDARLAGLISWDSIEDRGRGAELPYRQPDLVEAFNDLPYRYAPDLWAGQDNYVEIWVEKDALSNVVERPARRWNVGYLACRGYLSSSEAWRASNRFNEMSEAGRQCHMIHLGDHDPSGLDMTRDNYERMTVFGADVIVHRIALNMDQISLYRPPENPAKVTDTRYDDYRRRFGAKSWELDALEPRVIEGLINDKIRELIDLDLFNRKKAERQRERDVLLSIENNAEEVIDFARRNFE